MTLENDKGEDIEIRTKKINKARKNLGHWNEPLQLTELASYGNIGRKWQTIQLPNNTHENTTRKTRRAQLDAMKKDTENAQIIFQDDNKQANKQAREMDQYT